MQQNPNMPQARSGRGNRPSISQLSPPDPNQSPAERGIRASSYPQLPPTASRQANQPPTRPPPGGGYQQRRGDNTDDFSCIECCATVGSYILFIITLPFSLFCVFKIVQEYERAIIFRLGRVRKGARGPGIFFVLPCIDTYISIDLRTVSFDVPPQEALTKDSVTVAVDAVVYYKVEEPLKAVTKITNYGRSTHLLAMTTLRNILGTCNLADVLANRETISATLRETLDIATDPWGIRVERVEIKDVRLPGNLQRAMAAEAEASREARAKIVAAEGEMKASRALKEASEIIMQSPAALQLRYLQTLNTIASEKNSTIVFPFPMEMLTNFSRR